jgi:hypothetical protein
MIFNIIFFGVILPAIITLVINAISWNAKKRDSEPIKNGFWGLPLGLGLSYIAGHIGILGKPPIPPVESTQWLVFIALIMIVSGLIDSLIKLPVIAKVIIRAVSSGAVFYLTAMPMIKNTWATNQSITWSALITIAITIYWFLLEFIFKKNTDNKQTSSSVITIGLISGAIAGFSVFSSSAALAQLTGVIGASIGGLFFVSIFKKNFSAEKGLASISLLLAMLLLNTYLYADVKSLASIALLIISPSFSLLGDLKALDKLKPWQKVIIKGILVAIPLVISLGLVADFSEKSAEDEYYG